MWLVLLGLLACDRVPRNIDDSFEVDRFLSQQNYAAACVGLKNRADPSVRTYTARQLVKHEMKGAPRKCLCAALYDAEKHTAGLAVAKGIEGSRRDDLAGCLAPALTDPEVEERAKVAAALGRLNSPVGFEALEEVVKSAPEPGLRAAAAAAVKNSARARHTLVAALKSDKDVGVRAAAARALGGRQQDEVVKALGDVLDEPGVPTEVRAAALGALVESGAPGAATQVCQALMRDNDVTMRQGAARAFHGSKKRLAIDCLKRRLMSNEDNPAVRTAAMEALGASPSDRAAEALCDLIAPMMKQYVTHTIAEETAGVNIVRYQNDRDWEQSYACVQKALDSGGLSCYARNHLGRWMNDLGGKASTPLCPGMKRN